MTVMKDKNKTIRVHRIGSITFGIMLVVFGILFIIHEIFPKISYRFIFNMWPLALILLGVEILVSIKRKEEKYVYDKVAIILMMVVLMFSMVFAAISVAIKEGIADSDGHVTYKIERWERGVF